MACHCNHCDKEELSEESEEEEEKSPLRTWGLLIFGIACLITGFVLQKTDRTYGEITWAFFSDSAFYHSYAFIAFIIYSVGYAFLLTDLIPDLWESIEHHSFFSESLLMTVATAGAYAINEYPEALFVILFHIVGEMLEDYATDRSKASIRKLINRMPLVAHVVMEDGRIEDRDPSDVAVGSTLEIRPGEKVSVDGIIISGRASVDMSSLNGESLPKELTVNDALYSGSIVTDSVLRITTTKAFRDSTLSQIMDLVQNEQKTKSRSEKFITRFAKIYTPAVMGIALLVFLIPYAVSGFSWSGDNGGKVWLFKALSVLLVSCPCALVISIPIAFFAGMGQSSKIGALIKGSLAIENLSRSKTFVFDKTGTLTKGNFSLINKPSPDLLKLGASLEAGSTHPLGKAIRDAYQGELSPVSNFVNLPGLGIQGTIDGTTYVLGNEKLLAQSHVEGFTPEETPYKVLYLAKANGAYLGCFIVADELKDTTKEAIAHLRSEGVEKTIMLSGDDKRIADEVARTIGLDEAQGDLMPTEKLDRVKQMADHGRVCYVGDGINDSPSLLASTVGVSMGALGSDAAIEASDVVIMNDDLNKVAEARRLAKKTMTKVKGAIVISLLLKVTVMVLIAFGVFGDFTMLVAAVSDTGVMAVAILYVMTLMLYRPKYLKSVKSA